MKTDKRLAIQEKPQDLTIKTLSKVCYTVVNYICVFIDTLFQYTVHILYRTQTRTTDDDE